MPTIEYSGVIGGGRGYTQVTTPDGRSFTVKGDRALRNNNPGNLEYRGWQNAFGALGTDGRFAVFGTREQGLRAQAHLMFDKYSQNKTISQAIGAYAPPHENNTAAYAAAVAAAAGVSPHTKLKDLTPAQKTSMVEAMHKVEGNTAARAYDMQTGQHVYSLDARHQATPQTAPAPWGRGQPGPYSQPSPAETYGQLARSMADTGLRNIAGDTVFSAPLGQVTRGPTLAPAHATPAAAAQAQKTTQAYQDMAKSMAPVGVTGVGAMPAPAPSAGKLAGAYGQLAASLGAAGLNSLGAMPATPPTAPVPTAAPRAPALPAPVAVTPPPAPPPAPPMPAPPMPAQVMQNYAAAPAPAPSMPAGPSVADIYGGVIGSAKSRSGNIVSRDPFGNTSVTNKYGATTVTTPGGYQAATSIGAPISQGVQSMGARAGSLFSPPSTQFGGAVRGAAGSVAGSMLGGMLGPVGSILGGIIGREMALGRNPLGILSGQSIGRNSFPSAPDGPRTGASFSNRSDREMRDISPAAADAIGKGKGGLY